MVRKSSLLLVTSWLASVQATISSKCINLRLQNRWLVGDCLTGSGTTRIESSVYLQTKIANHEGVLEVETSPQVVSNARYPLLPLYSTVNADQRGASIYQRRLLWANEHIAVYNGFLLSNLSGTPTPPSVVSSIRLPEDPSWKLVYGNTSCYSENTGTCPSPTVGNGVTCSAGTSVGASDGVSNCFAFRWPISFPVWVTFGSLQVDAPSRAFRFNVYDTVDCSGGVKGTIEPNELGTCKAFKTQLLAFSAVPLWNGQT
ncbi:hypothetical protein TWF506_001128 [Arthrobotrys conoides]|uniref:Uncharacterized protein n=1 Tax=Arthrobotrys conoides TaxID=74498 RepID=A0AAN8NMZ1_9PEZI